MRERYFTIRGKLLAAGLWPVTRLARIAWYCVRMAALVFVLGWLLKLVRPSWGEVVGGSVNFFLVVAALFFCAVGFRWVRKKLLWRLRNRLIVTYIFIGVVPVLLLAAMAGVTLYLFAGQFASFVVTQEIESQLRNLESANAAITNELASRLEHGLDPSPESLAGLRKRDPRWARREVCAWHGKRALPACAGPKGASRIAFPEFFEKEAGIYARNLRQKQLFHQVVRDRGALYLRAACVFPVNGEKLTVVTSEPLDKDLIGGIATELGEITLYASSGIAAENDDPATPNVGGDPGKSPILNASDQAAKDKGGIVIRQNQNGVSANGTRLDPKFQVGSLPGASNAFDREIQFPTPLPDVDWETGEDEPVSALVHVRTRPSLLYAHLFAALGSFAKGVEYILLGVGIVFALIEAAALFVGTRMTRTVTGTVANLYEATKHVDRADFSHRIPVTSTDQLSLLSLSFNSMTASIEKLVLEQKEKQRLENELVIAQEVQAQLFPRQATELESLEVHGFCRPARTVSGDYYDFVAAGPHRLILAVGDISGKGISAALLMATIHSAVRAYSRPGVSQIHAALALGADVAQPPSASAEISPAALLRLLNHQLYESTPMEKYATLFLAVYDSGTRRLTYSNGGHLPPLLIGEDGSVRRLECGGTVIGLFDGMQWEEDSVILRPGEIFLAYSDGITEPENEFGEFGEGRLLALARKNRALPLAQISQLVTTAVDDWIGDQEQPDDVTLVLARAR